MLLHKTFDGSAEQLAFNIAGHKYILKDIKGLRFELRAGLYDPAGIQEYFDGVEELTLLEQIQETRGELLPFFQVELLDTLSSASGEDTFIPETEDERPAYTLEIELLDPTRKKGLAVFYSDEDGDCDWITADGSYIVSDTKRSFEFLIPRPEKIDAIDEVMEFGIKNRSVIRIVSWLDDVPEGHFEAKDTKGKKYEMHRVVERDPGDWIFEDFPKKGPQRKELWQSLSKGKTLLLVHGTNGTSSIAFRRFLDQRDWMEALNKKYEGRIISFNHPTLFRGVKHNAKKLKKFLAESGLPLNLDVMSRSRGGLVSRQLLEKTGLPDGVSVEKFLMLSAPNQGTPASKGLNKIKIIRVNHLLGKVSRKVGHVHKKFDKYELFYEIAQVKEEVLDGPQKALIQGATDQALGSEFLSELNDGGQRIASKSDLPKYYAITCVFDPNKMELQGHDRLKNKLAKKLRNIFEERENDGIVPTKGAMGEMDAGISSPLFNIKDERCYVLQHSPNTHHINLPDSKEVRDKVLEFLVD